MRKLFILLTVAALMACDNDPYDTGTGTYSLMRADFCEAYTGEERAVEYVITDEEDVLILSPTVTASWITQPDTAYRALLYYNVSDDKIVEPLSISNIPVLMPHAAAAYDSIYTDPITFESVWISTSGKYLNIGFYLKNGQDDDEESSLHTIGMVLEGITVNSDTTTTMSLRLYHDQGGVPEYYSSKYYASVPCSYLTTDSVTISFNTYDGEVVKSLALK